MRLDLGGALVASKTYLPPGLGSFKGTGGSRKLRGGLHSTPARNASSIYPFDDKLRGASLVAFRSQQGYK